MPMYQRFWSCVAFPFTIHLPRCRAWRGWLVRSAIKVDRPCLRDPGQSSPLTYLTMEAHSYAL